MEFHNVFILKTIDREASFLSRTLVGSLYLLQGASWRQFAFFSHSAVNQYTEPKVPCPTSSCVREIFLP